MVAHALINGYLQSLFNLIHKDSKENILIWWLASKFLIHLGVKLIIFILNIICVFFSQFVHIGLYVLVFEYMNSSVINDTYQWWNNHQIVQWNWLVQISKKQLLNNILIDTLVEHFQVQICKWKCNKQYRLVKMFDIMVDMIDKQLCVLFL